MAREVGREIRALGDGERAIPQGPGETAWSNICHLMTLEIEAAHVFQITRIKRLGRGRRRNYRFGTTVVAVKMKNREDLQNTGRQKSYSPFTSRSKRM